MAAAASPLPVSVYEYLHSVYKPDVDYVDGVLEDRNLGEFDHQAIQRALLFALANMERENGFYTAIELRVQVSPTRFRVPDLCLLPAGRLPARIATEPPLLCIEVLSPEDSLPRIRQRCEDYLRFGVPAIWIIDPQQRTAYVLGQDERLSEQRDGMLRLASTNIELSLPELFMSLNR